ncbi:MAG: cobaltochelatase subunit CobN [Desulfobacter sp.]|nr:cobaltochelatase subunit CobN [Desulfobacter sp.]
MLWISLIPTKAMGADLAFMVLDHNAYMVHEAVHDLKAGLDSTPGTIDIRVITVNDVLTRPVKTKKTLENTKLILVDVMGLELASFLKNQIDLSSKTIYALRGSVDDAALKDQGFLFDPEVSSYYQHLSIENIINLLRLTAHRHLNKAIPYEPVKKRPQLGLYHPDAPKAMSSGFTKIEDYLEWQKNRPQFDPDRPHIGFFFFSSFLTKGQKQPVDCLIKKLEAQGFNVLPCFGREQSIIKQFLLDKDKKARVDMVLAFSFKFYNGLTPELRNLLNQLDVPVFNAISIYKDTIDQWRSSPVGLDNLEVAWSLAVPEISGLIEPTVLGAKKKKTDKTTGQTVFISRPVVENIDRLIIRLKKWVTLQNKPNPEKKIALMFYNHHQGKQNIGASYLNVFKSIKTIIQALNQNGYTTGTPLTEAQVKALLLTSARNIGSWAPGELDKMTAKGKIIRLPMATYKGWFKTLPKDFRNKVVKQWEEPEKSGMFRILCHGFGSRICLSASGSKSQVREWAFNQPRRRS